MINNRQGGRRRGRGGQRGQNLGGQPGNRQDNRQRGNAAQLLEKYKSMARDAQLAGDRVQTEYYLQFADHYFRVLSESRARFEEQNPQPRQRDDEFDDEDGGDEEMVEAEARPKPPRPMSARIAASVRRGTRRAADREPRRFNRDERGANEDERSPSSVLASTAATAFRSTCFRRRSAPTEAAGDEETAAPRPRRRTRTARPADGDEEVAPAA